MNEAHGLPLKAGKTLELTCNGYGVFVKGKELFRSTYKVERTMGKTLTSRGINKNARVQGAVGSHGENFVPEEEKP